MSNIKRARPILILFVVAFLSILGILYVSMDWVDQIRKPGPSQSEAAKTAKPDMYAPD